jgi:hypothetical protein
MVCVAVVRLNARCGALEEEFEEEGKSYDELIAAAARLNDPDGRVAKAAAAARAAAEARAAALAAAEADFGEGEFDVSSTQVGSALADPIEASDGTWVQSVNRGNWDDLPLVEQQWEYAPCRHAAPVPTTPLSLSQCRHASPVPTTPLSLSLNAATPHPSPQPRSLSLNAATPHPSPQPRSRSLLSHLSRIAIPRSLAHSAAPPARPHRCALLRS